MRDGDQSNQGARAVGSFVVSFLERALSVVRALSVARVRPFVQETTGTKSLNWPRTSSANCL